MNSYLPQWIQDAETILSLIGFGLTVFVYKAISDVKKSYQRKTRLPEIIKDLSSYASALSKALSAGDLVAARTEIRSAHSLIIKSQKIVSSAARKELSLSLKKLDPLVSDKAITNIDMNALWVIYSEVHTAIRSIDQSIKDAKWE